MKSKFDQFEISITQADIPRLNLDLLNMGLNFSDQDSKHFFHVKTYYVNGEAQIVSKIKSNFRMSAASKFSAKNFPNFFYGYSFTNMSCIPDFKSFPLHMLFLKI